MKTRMQLSEVKNATVEELQEELAAAGIDSSSNDIDYLREAVTELLREKQSWPGAR